MIKTFRHPFSGIAIRVAMILAVCMVCCAGNAWAAGWGETQTLVAADPTAPDAPPLYLLLTPTWQMVPDSTYGSKYIYTYSLQNPNIEVPPSGYPGFYYIDNFRLSFYNAFPTILKPISAPEGWHAVEFAQPLNKYWQIEWRLNEDLTPEQEAFYILSPNETMEFVLESPDRPSQVPWVLVLAGSTYGSGEWTFGPVPESYSPPPPVPEWSSVFLALVGLSGLHVCRFRVARR